MITYRTFRNPDPPLIVELWNASLAGQRVVPLRGATLLEYFILAKPYFDPAGLHLAFKNGKAVGLALAGFVPNASRTALDHSAGVISLIAVLPSCRRRGIGTRLLELTEGYLRTRGARVALAGGMAHAEPFLFGLYGGCSSPGLVAGLDAALPFCERRGYTLARSCAILRRSLTRLQTPADERFQAIRERYDIIAAPARRVGWWRECVLGPVEAVEYRLQDKRTAAAPARMLLWDMDTFCLHWGESCVGLIDLEVAEGQRRTGLAKYLLANTLRHLRERSFHFFEAQADTASAPALGLLAKFEFEQVEAGYALRKEL